MSIKDKAGYQSELKNIIKSSVSFLEFEKEIEKVKNVSSRMAVAMASAIAENYNNYFNKGDPVVISGNVADLYDTVSKIRADVETHVNKRDREQVSLPDQFKAFNTHLDTYLKAKSMLTDMSERSAEIKEQLGEILLLNKNDIDNIRLNTDLDNLGSETVFAAGDSFVLVTHYGDDIDTEVMTPGELKEYVNNIEKVNNLNEVNNFIETKERNKETDIER